MKLVERDTFRELISLLNFRNVRHRCHTKYTCNILIWDFRWNNELKVSWSVPKLLVLVLSQPEYIESFAAQSVFHEYRLIRASYTKYCHNKWVKPAMLCYVILHGCYKKTTNREVRFRGIWSKNERYNDVKIWVTKTAAS